MLNMDRGSKSLHGRLIQRASEVRLPLSGQQGGAMLGVLNDTLRLAAPDLQSAAVAALGAFSAAYAAPPRNPHAKPPLNVDVGMEHDSAGQHRDPNVPQPCDGEEATLSDCSGGRGMSAAVSVQPGPYVAGLAVSSGGAVRRGSAMALGALPAPLLCPVAQEVIAALAAAVQVTSRARGCASLTQGCLGDWTPLHTHKHSYCRERCTRRCWTWSSAQRQTLSRTEGFLPVCIAVPALRRWRQTRTAGMRRAASARCVRWAPSHASSA